MAMERNTDWVEEHLAVIRTLMERVQVYRRALAAVSLFVGSMGVGGAIVGSVAGWSSGRSFLSLWFIVAVLTGAGALALIRIQAIRSHEPVFSPATRRVLRAGAPAVFSGLVATIVLWVGTGGLILEEQAARVAPIIWTTVYGLGLNAAGFFMQRGIRWLGWLFVLCGWGLAFLWVCGIRYPNNPNTLMAVIFGGIHLVYALYLHLTRSEQSP